MTLTDVPEFGLDTGNRTEIAYEDDEITGERWNGDYQELNKRVYYKHLSEINEGRRHTYHNVNSEYVTDNQLAYIAEVVSDRLHLNTMSTDRVPMLLRRLDRHRLGLRLIWVAHAVALFVVRNDERDERTAHPASDDRHEDFTEFEDDIEIRNLASIYGTVASRLR